MINLSSFFSQNSISPSLSQNSLTISFSQIIHIILPSEISLTLVLSEFHFQSGMPLILLSHKLHIHYISQNSLEHSVFLRIPSGSPWFSEFTQKRPSFCQNSLRKVLFPVRNLHLSVRNIIFLSEFYQKRLSFYQNIRLSLRNVVFPVRIPSEMSDFLSESSIFLSQTSIHFVRNTHLSVRNLSETSVFLLETPIFLSELSQKCPSFCQ